jgi:tRNA A-37 threonylcarbamoyl transferase component Bud32
MEGLRYFATLKPANTVAKLAFSELVESGTANEDSQPRRLMLLEPEKIFDRDALRYNMEYQRQLEQHEDTETASPTEPDTDTEKFLRHQGMLWTGSYMISLDHVPINRAGLGWIAGKAGNPLVDLVLATRRFAQAHDLQLRSNHARFNFSAERAAFLIARYSRSARSELAVNGTTVTSVHFLNQQSMKIRISALEYDFSYTPFAYTHEYYEDLNRIYLPLVLRATVNSTSIQIPTPQGPPRTFGDWTVSEPLGRGAEGNVFSASNRHGEVVALKVVLRAHNNAHQAESEIRTLKTLTKLAETHDETRLLRLRQAIYPRDTPDFDTANNFDEVALIFEPVATMTLAAYIKANRNTSKLSRGMLLPAAALFRQILRAVQFLHRHGWLHGDIKPENIGITGAHSAHDVVLLDLGRSKHVGSPDTAVNPNPGCGGTVRYLAPEQELRPYTQLVDAWALGVTGFELAYGYHPWPLAKNPWRFGKTHEELRPRFHELYEEAMACLSTERQLLGKEEESLDGTLPENLFANDA